MIQTVIFDMDGVLIDSEPIHHLAYIQHFKELEIEVDKALYNSFVGGSTKNIYKRIKDIYELSHSVEDLVNRKRALFSAVFDQDVSIKLMDGVFDLIKELHQNGIQLIVASSSSYTNINMIFEKFGLNPYFSAKVSGEDFPESKPNPAIFNKAVELSGHQKETCIIIEDSTNGIKAANAAGVFVIGFKAIDSFQDYTTADMVVSSYDELSYEIIAEINPKPEYKNL
jgi:beta-phosphoglucomutase